MYGRFLCYACDLKHLLPMEMPPRAGHPWGHKMLGMRFLCGHDQRLSVQGALKAASGGQSTQPKAQRQAISFGAPVCQAVSRTMLLVLYLQDLRDAVHL